MSNDWMLDEEVLELAIKVSDVKIKQYLSKIGDKCITLNELYEEVKEHNKDLHGNCKSEIPVDIRLTMISLVLEIIYSKMKDEEIN